MAALLILIWGGGVIAVVVSIGLVRAVIQADRASAITKEGRMNQLFANDRLSNQQWHE